MVALNARGIIGFYSGDVTKLQEELYTLQPTILFAVPRVLARIRQGIYEKVGASKFKVRLLNTAVNHKQKSVNRQIYKHNTLWDKVVFSKIRQRFGGRIRFILTGGAPTSSELLQFIRAVFSCPVSNIICSNATDSTATDAPDLLNIALCRFSNVMAPPKPAAQSPAPFVVI